MDDKLICPVKRLNKSNIDLQVDMTEDDMNINIDIHTKNPIKSIIDFVNKKFKKNKE